MDERFQKVSCQRKRRANAERKLHPVIVTDVDKIGRRVKIHFVGWDIVNGIKIGGHAIRTDADNIILLSSGWNLPSIPSSASSDDRRELVYGELHREIKRKLYAGRKDDPATRIEVPVDQYVNI